MYTYVHYSYGMLWSFNGYILVVNGKVLFINGFSSVLVSGMTRAITVQCLAPNTAKLVYKYNFTFGIVIPYN